MLDKIFIQVLNMSFTASYVILFIMLARIALSRAPKLFSYALWSVALFRLVCPLSFESALSLLSIGGRTTKQLRPFVVQDADFVLAQSNVTQNLLPGGMAPSALAPEPLYENIFTILWLAGILLMLIYSAITLFKLKKQLKGSVNESSNIYISDSLATPFVMGVLNPKIYLPAFLSGNEKEYILLHERTHIRRLDHIIKPLSFLVLCVHWFNPLVWAAFFLSGRDMEMSCDEAVIKKLGGGVKKDYSTSLLSLSTGIRIVGGTPLAFGEGDAKNRIKNVLSYKRPAFLVAAIAVIAVAVLCICLAANPLQKDALTRIDFPAYQDGKNEYNQPIYEATPFSVELYLPENWEIRLPAEENNDAVDFFSTSFFTELEIWNGDKFIGQIGYNIFEPYDGEIPPEEYYKTVYPNLRLGSMYCWDQYTPVKSTKTSETALATVRFPDEKEIDKHPGAMPDVPEIKAPGILSYDKERLVYIGIQFNKDAAKHKEIQKIAKNIRFSDSQRTVEMLHSHRTNYLGDNSSAGAIISALSFPDKIDYDGFELFTSQEPYSLSVKLKTDAEIRNYYSGEALQQPFQINACILFSLIENVEYINFELDDGIHDPYGMQYTRQWADGITGANLWSESESLDKFTSLYYRIPDIINEAMYFASKPSAAQQGGLTFFVKPDEPARVIGETAAKVWLNSYMEQTAPEVERIKDYNITNITVISGDPKEGVKREDMKYHYVVRINYGITTATENYRMPGDGIAGFGTFEGLFREIYVKDLGGGNFDIIGAGTGGGEQEFYYDPLETAVSDAILIFNMNRYPDYDFACEAHTVLATEAMGPAYNSDIIEQLTVYAVVNYAQYKFENGEPKLSEGSHMPVAITFETDGESYTLEEYWVPRDGAGYVDSIKKKFPPDIVNDVMDMHKYAEKHASECNQKAKEYYLSH